MRSLSITLFALLAMGCTRPDPELLQELERKDALVTELREEIERLEAELADTRRRYNQRMDQLKEITEQNRRVHESVVSDYRKQLRLKEQRIEGLEQDLRFAHEQMRSLEDEIAELNSPPPPTEADEESEPVVTVPAADIEDVFPVRVFDIVGEQVVTGTRVQPRFVETDEIFKDEYGNEQVRMRVENEIVNEYGYQVTFSLENLTDQDRIVSVRAGRLTRAVTVRAGETVNDVAVDAAKGSGLMVMVGGKSRRYEVTYADEEPEAEPGQPFKL